MYSTVPTITIIPLKPYFKVTTTKYFNQCVNFLWFHLKPLSKHAWCKSISPLSVYICMRPLVGGGRDKTLFVLYTSRECNIILSSSAAELQDHKDLCLVSYSLMSHHYILLFLLYRHLFLLIPRQHVQY